LERISDGDDKKDEGKGKQIEEEKAEPEKETKEGETNLIQSRYEVAVKLQDLQADPNSPLYSVKSFDELGLYFLPRYAYANPVIRIS